MSINNKMPIILITFAIIGIFEVILIVFFLVYRGGGDFFGSEDGVSEEVSEEIVCESDEECVFVVSGEGCGFIEGSCNIMGNETCEGALFDESVACGCFEGVCGITQDI